MSMPKRKRDCIGDILGWSLKPWWTMPRALPCGAMGKSCADACPQGKNLVGVDMCWSLNRFGEVRWNPRFTQSRRLLKDEVDEVATLPTEEMLQRIKRVKELITPI